MKTSHGYRRIFHNSHAIQTAADPRYIPGRKMTSVFNIPKKEKFVAITIIAAMMHNVQKISNGNPNKPAAPMPDTFT